MLHPGRVASALEALPCPVVSEEWPVALFPGGGTPGPVRSVLLGVHSDCLSVGSWGSSRGLRKEEILLWVFPSLSGSEGPVSGVGRPVRSAHVCQKRSLWCGRTNMLNLCSSGKSSGLEVVSAATTATTFSKSSSRL